MKKRLAGFLAPALLLLIISNAFSVAPSSKSSPTPNHKPASSKFSIAQFLQIDPASIRLDTHTTYPSAGNSEPYRVVETERDKNPATKSPSKNVDLKNGRATLSVFKLSKSATAGLLLKIDSDDPNFQCKDILKEAIQAYGKPVLNYVDDTPLLSTHILSTAAGFEFPNKRTDFSCMDFQHFKAEPQNGELQESSTHSFFITGSKEDIEAFQKRTLIQCETVSSTENSTVEDTTGTYYFYVDPNSKALRRRDGSIVFKIPEVFTDQRIYIHHDKAGENKDLDYQLKLDRVTGELLMRAESPPKNGLPKVVINYRGTCKPITEEKKF